MAVPTFQGIGAGSETSAAWPTHAADDWGYLPVVTSSGTVTTPAGWTHVWHIANGAGTVTLALFKLKATSGAMAAASLAGGSSFLWGRIFTSRGADLTESLLTSFTGYATAASVTGFAPGGVTDENDCLIVHLLAWAIDNAGPIASSWTNATLSGGGGITEQGDDGTVTGDGGGLTLASGSLATAGYTGVGTVTLTSTTFACATLVIRPPRAASGSGISRSRAVNS